MREIPQLYLTFIGKVEGDSLTSFQDSGGKWTVGKGHTGPEVCEGMIISEDESNHLCVADSHVAMGRLYAAAKGAILDALPEHEFSALLSFVFNVGADPSWTIWKDVNAGRMDDVPTQLVRFDKIKEADGKVITVPGLLHRRVAEVELFNTADVEAAVKIMAAAPVAPPPSSVTRGAVTPPARALPAIPAIKQKTTWAAGLVALLGIASSLQACLQSSQQSLDQALPGVTWLPTFDHYSGAAVAGLGILIMVVRSIDEQLKTQ